MAPSSTMQWVVTGKSGLDDLKFTEGKLPKLGETDVLVKWHYASLNYRDLIIPKGLYPFEVKENVVLGSDAAGEVVSFGPKVTHFKSGDRVIGVFTQDHQDGPIKEELKSSALGGPRDGVLQGYSVLPEHGLIPLPETLDYQQASTLPCAAVTAWNALNGLVGKRLMAGQWLLTQGSGGVSIFGLQFAKAAGARVIATSSSAEKCETLKKLGADHVINYRETDNWGEEAKKLTGGVGVDHIIEVGGAKTLQESLVAIKPEGVISVIGFVSGATGDGMPNMLHALLSLCTVRGLMVGSKAQFEEMNACIVANNIKPVVDKRVFELKDLKAACEYMWEQKHFGKVTIKIA